MNEPLPTTRTELVPWLEARGLRLSRRLGQNFLVDPALARAIVADAAVGPADHVLEIGPGAGALTVPLLATGATVTAVELDHGLAAALRDHLGDEPRFRLLAGDCLDGGDLRAEIRDACAAGRPDGGRVLVVSNLPYASGSVVLARLLLLPEGPDGVVAMLQKEVVERLRARTGTGDYGPLAVLAAAAARVEVLRRVPPEVFFPRPDVESTLFRVDLLPGRDPRLLGRMDRLLRAAFSQRRKRIGRTLRDEVPVGALAAAGIDPDLRPEAVPPERWAALARAGGPT